MFGGPGGILKRVPEPAATAPKVDMNLTKDSAPTAGAPDVKKCSKMRPSSTKNSR